MKRIEIGVTISHHDPAKELIIGSDVEAKELEDIQFNMGQVTDFALSIDNLLAAIISGYFRPADESRFELFSSWIAESSALSFKPKFDIVREIIASDDKLQIAIGFTDLTKSLKELKDHFNRVLMYRNAFAHGKVESSRDGTFTIHHFHGEPKVEQITEDRFEKIKNSCKRLFTPIWQVNAELQKVVG